MLIRFRASQNARERDIFGCMVHNLFDEYRFFPKYPEKELRITAVLFGRLVNHQLVVSITLGVALRCVLDALRKPFGTKMFAFGSEALEQFKQRLPEWRSTASTSPRCRTPRAHPDLAASSAPPPSAGAPRSAERALLAGRRPSPGVAG